jgi:hypothetical protein
MGPTTQNLLKMLAFGLVHATQIATESPIC